MADYPCYSFIQILEGNKCLLIIDDHTRHQERLLVFLEDLNDLDASVGRGRAKKTLFCDKIGHDVTIAYDERKRYLAICGTDLNRVIPS